MHARNVLTAAMAHGGDLVAIAKEEFEGSVALREEFIDLAIYTAWRKAVAAGRVKFFGNQSAHAAVSASPSGAVAGHRVAVGAAGNLDSIATRRFGSLA